MLLNGLWNFSFENGEILKMSVPGCFDATPGFVCKRGKAVYWREVFCGGYTELHLEGIGLRAEIFWDNEKIMMRPGGFNNKGLVDEYRKPKLAWYDLKNMLKQ